MQNNNGNPVFVPRVNWYDLGEYAGFATRHGLATNAARDRSGKGVLRAVSTVLGSRSRDGDADFSPELALPSRTPVSDSGITSVVGHVEDGIGLRPDEHVGGVCELAGVCFFADCDCSLRVEMARSVVTSVEECIPAETIPDRRSVRTGPKGADEWTYVHSRASLGLVPTDGLTNTDSDLDDDVLPPLEDLDVPDYEEVVMKLRKRGFVFTGNTDSRFSDNMFSLIDCDEEEDGIISYPPFVFKEKKDNRKRLPRSRLRRKAKAWRKEVDEFRRKRDFKRDTHTKRLKALRRALWQTLWLMRIQRVGRQRQIDLLGWTLMNATELTGERPRPKAQMALFDIGVKHELTEESTVRIQTAVLDTIERSGVVGTLTEAANGIHEMSQSVSRFVDSMQALKDVAGRKVSEGIDLLIGVLTTLFNLAMSRDWSEGIKVLSTALACLGVTRIASYVKSFYAVISRFFAQQHEEEQENGNESGDDRRAQGQAGKIPDEHFFSSTVKLIYGLIFETDADANMITEARAHRVSTGLRSVKTIGEFCSWAFKNLDSALDWIRKWHFGITAMDELQEARKALEDIALETQEIERRLSSGETEKISSLLGDALRKLTEWPLKFKDPGIHKALSCYRDLLIRRQEKLAFSYSMAMRTHADRHRPCIVVLSGIPRQGKSVAIDMLAAAYLGLKGEEFHPSKVYTHAIGSDYFDTYNGQPVAVWDDVGQDSTKESRIKEMMVFIRAANKATYKLNMADVDQKGKFFFCSELIIITTNLKDIAGNSGLSSEEALRARLDLCFEVLRVNDNTVFYPRPPDALFSDYTEITKKTDKGFSCYEVAQAIHGTVDNHIANDESIKEQTRTINKRAMDDQTKRESFKSAEFLKRFKAQMMQVEPADHGEAIQMASLENLKEEAFLTKATHPQGLNLEQRREWYRQITADVMKLRMPDEEPPGFTFNELHFWIILQDLMIRGVDVKTHKKLVLCTYMLGAAAAYPAAGVSQEFRRNVERMAEFPLVDCSEIDVKDYCASKDVKDYVHSYSKIGASYWEEVKEAMIWRCQRTISKGQQLWEALTPQQSALWLVLPVVVGLGVAMASWLRPNGPHGQMMSSGAATVARASARSVSRPVTRVRHVDGGRAKGQYGDSVTTKLIEETYRHNLCKVQFTKLGAADEVILALPVMNGFSPGGRVVFTTGHYLDVALAYGEYNEWSVELTFQDRVYIFDFEDVDFLRDDDRDAMSMRLPKQFQYRRDIVNHFITEAELAKDLSSCVRFSLTDSVESVIQTGVERVQALEEEEYDIDDKRFKRTFKLVDGLRGVAPNTFGDCGSLIATHNATITGKICAMHVAGEPTYRRVLMEPLTKEYINRMMGHFKAEMPEIPEFGPAAHDVRPASVAVHVATNTCIRPAPFMAEESLRKQMTKRPAEMRIRKIETPQDDGTVKVEIRKPLDRGAARATKDERGNIDAQCFAEASGFFQNLMPHVHNTKPMTIDESISGVPGVPYKKALEVSTSFGILEDEHGARVPRNGKRDYMNFDPATRLWTGTKEFKEMQKKELRRIRRRKRTKYFKCLKDELRKFAKVESVDTRLITIAPAAFNALARRFFLNPMAELYTQHASSAFAIGINPHEGTAWGAQATRLRIGNKLWHKSASDIGNMDGSILKEIIEEICKQILIWLGDWQHIEHLTEEEKSAIWDTIETKLATDDEDQVYTDVEIALIREGILYATFHRTEVVGAWEYDIDRNNPTGSWITAFFNSCVTLFSICYSYAKAWKTKFAGTPDAEHPNWETFMKCVIPLVFGDDNVVSVHDAIAAWFDTFSLEKGFKDLGMQITDPGKTKELRAFIPDEELEFLQRKFSKTDSGWKAPLPMSTLINAILWRSKGDPPHVAQTKLVRGTLLEAFHHFDKPEWDRFQAHLNVLLKKHDCEPVVLSYGKLLGKWHGLGGLTDGASVPWEITLSDNVALRFVAQMGSLEGLGQQRLEEPGVTVAEKKDVVETLDSTVLDAREQLGRSTSEKVSTPYPPNLIAQLRRSYNVAGFTYSTTSTVGSLLGYLQFPNALFNSQLKIQDLLTRWSYMRGGVELEIRVTGSKMMQGHIIVAWCPNTAYNDPIASNPPYSLTCVPHVIIPTEESPTVKLKLNWNHPEDFFPIATSVCDIGTFWFAPLTPLRSTSASPTSSVDITIYANFCDEVVEGPTLDTTVYTATTNVSGRHPTGRAKAQMSSVQNEQIKESKSFKLSDVANGVSSVAGVVADVPIIGGFARPIQMIAGVVGKVLSIFGLDRPFSSTAVVPTSGSDGRGHALGSGSVMAETTSINPNAHVADDAGANVDTRDNMMIMNHIGHPCLVDLFSIPVSTATNTVIRRWPMTPMLTNATLNGSSGKVNYSMTHLAMAANLFEYYRGSKRVRIVLASTDFTVFWVRFFLLPQSATLPTSLTAGDGDVRSELFEVRGSTSIDLIVPYLYPRRLQRTGGPMTNVSITATTGPSAAYSDAWADGNLLMVLESPIVTSSTVLTNIDVSVFYCAGPDFQFVRPRSALPQVTFSSALAKNWNAFNNIPDPSSEDEFYHEARSGPAAPSLKGRAKAQMAQHAKTNPVIGDAELAMMKPARTFQATTLPTVYGFNSNEELTNWRTYLHRFGVLGDTVTAVAGANQRFTFPSVPYTLPLTPEMQILCRCFRWFRGSMIVRAACQGVSISTTDMPIKGHVYVSQITPSQLVNGVSNATLGGVEGAAVFDLSQTRTLTVHLQWTHPQRVVSTAEPLSTLANGPQPVTGSNSLAPEWALFEIDPPPAYYSPTPASYVFRVYQSVGDDFNFSVLQWPGYCQLTAAITNPDTV